MDEKEKSNIMKNVLIIGLGRFGRHIAMELNQLGHEIMAVDWKEERVDKVLPFVTNAQIGDSTNAEFLQSLGIGHHVQLWILPVLLPVLSEGKLSQENSESFPQ